MLNKVMSSINSSKLKRMQFTKNFHLHEFRCKDGSETPLEVVYRLQKIAIQLQVLRDFLDTSIKINSGYRSPSHNKKVGGVSNSQHVLGNASDITSERFSPKEIYDAIEFLINEGCMLQGGLGLYNSFVHYDIGYNGKRRRW